MDNLTAVSDFVQISNVAFGLGLSGTLGFLTTIVLFLIHKRLSSQCVINNVTNDIHNLTPNDVEKVLEAEMKVAQK